MNEESNIIDFEDIEFWKKSIKKAIAKRLINKGFTYNHTLQNICELSEKDIDELLDLSKSYMNKIDFKLRLKYLDYFEKQDYNEWNEKFATGIGKKDYYEIYEGNRQYPRLDFENIIENRSFEKGENLVNNLALINMVDLNYSKKNIINILGDYKTKNIELNPFIFSNDITEKIRIHGMNKKITNKQEEILVKLLSFENNIKNASIITDLSEKEINKFISDNYMFKSDNEEMILDFNKIRKTRDLWNCELLIEVITIDGISNNQIPDYSKLSNIDEKYFKSIFELYNEFKLSLEKILKEIAEKLFNREFELKEIEEIVGTNNLNVPKDYFFKMLIKHLKNEKIEELL